MFLLGSSWQQIQLSEPKLGPDPSEMGSSEVALWVVSLDLSLEARERTSDQRSVTSPRILLKQQLGSSDHARARVHTHTQAPGAPAVTSE